MKIMVVDTETANTIDEPFAYDIGGIVADTDGHIFATFSYVVAEIFLDKEMMASAYFADKVPQYWEDIKSGKRELRTLRSIVREIRSLMREYDVNKVFAFNVPFDYRSTNYVERLCTGSKFRYFFPYGTEFHDILKMARAMLKGNEDYTKFCVENSYTDSRGHNRHTAEIVFRFLFDDAFNEDHTAKEDAVIEYAILLKCLKHGITDSKLW